MDKNHPLYLGDKEFHDIVTDKDTLRKCSEGLLYNIVDEMTLGIVLELHRKRKLNMSFNECKGTAIVDEDNADIFGQHNMKKTQECECPNCHGAVAAAGFAPHLEVCMGMRRSRYRNASRRLANNNNNYNSNNNNNNNATKEREATSYTGMQSDDEKDADWNKVDKRKKKKHRNGSKKGKGTPKKVNSESESVESLNVDIEGDEDAEISLRDFMQDNSNHSSPAESMISTSSSGSKKKEKSKNKKKHDRISPSTSLGD